MTISFCGSNQDYFPLNVNPGSLFAPWDGTTAQTDGPAGHYEATGAPANERKRYKYSIHLMKGGERLDIDPEIMNDPPTT